MMVIMMISRTRRGKRREDVRFRIQAIQRDIILLMMMMTMTTPLSLSYYYYWDSNIREYSVIIA